MEIFGWLVVTVLSFLFFMSGILCYVGASDQPQKKSFQILFIGLIFGLISYFYFPF